jgi:hypothetical protein
MSNPHERHTDYEPVAPTYDRRYERNSYAGVEQALRLYGTCGSIPPEGSA